MKGAPHVFIGGNLSSVPSGFRSVFTADNMAEYRRRRVIGPRRNPLLFYDEANFKRRYRLTKASVADLAMQYSASEYCSTMCSDVGGGITAGERVSLINFISK